MSRRIDTLMAQMTLPEKLGQLTMTASSYAVTGPVIAGDSTDSIKDGTLGNLLNMVGSGPTHEVQNLAIRHSRLKIPLLIGLDILHGHRTQFPIPLAEACTFDPDVWTLTAREAAHEAAADGLAMTFAPMIDVARDPRWGRMAEGPGEDPWLAMQFARAKVQGFQGPDLAADTALAACAKHYCAYGPVTAGREYASVDISDRTLHEVHLPAFEAAVAAGVASVMPAFTDLNGIPMTMHVPLLREHLREKLGFDGVLVSDYHAIAELLNHGVAADLADAAALSLKAGVDIDMMSDAYRRGLPIALQRGTVTMADIDASVRRVLALKERLGLFDRPLGRGSKKETRDAIAHRRQIAREIGARSIVMLKNDGDVLPLAGSIKRLCVLGPLADAANEMPGPWAAAGGGEPHVSVLEGLRHGLPGAEIVSAAGVTIRGEGTEREETAGIPAALDLIDRGDVLILCLGEAANMSGEAASRAHLDLPGRQRAFATAAIQRAHARNLRVIVILFSGRPLVIPWLADDADALLAAWFPGTEAGNAIADVITGLVSPSGRTAVSWPRAVGQIPVFFGERPTGRPENPQDHFTSKYLDLPNSPLFPFGHGLSYGRFIYERIDASPTSVGETDHIEVHVQVRNDGRRAAEETVFLFVHDRIASVARPALELRGFAKIVLRAGETGTVRLTIPAVDLRFLGAALQPVFEPGEVELLAGPCADRARLLATTIRMR